VSNTKRSIVLVSTCGLLSGVAGSVVGGMAIRQLQEPPVERRSPVLDAKEAGAKHWLRENQLERLARLEERLNAKDDSPSSDKIDTPPQEPPSHPDPEEESEKLVQHWEDRLQRYADEPEDRVWAAPMKKSLESSVSSLATQGHFTLVETECRSQTCSATVEWKDYSDAMESHSQLIFEQYGPNCARDVFLPEPEDRQVPYQATVLYDCSQSPGKSQSPSKS
jgi:hypothetical protein